MSQLVSCASILPRLAQVRFIGSRCDGAAVVAGMSMARLHVARLAAIASYLLFIPAARQVSHAHHGPAQFGHHFRQTSVGTRGAVALAEAHQAAGLSKLIK
jgi:hypothetical protein